MPSEERQQRISEIRIKLTPAPADRSARPVCHSEQIPRRNTAGGAVFIPKLDRVGAVLVYHNDEVQTTPSGEGGYRLPSHYQKYQNTFQ
ncbi:MAG TPA: hypothetical protein VLT36_02450 [Candidatus Dormibacteraeota bacterium]|nr:hypothetical protein [Candidatus Dormibacteraeota bacterium]